LGGVGRWLVGVGVGLGMIGSEWRHKRHEKTNKEQ